MYQTIITRQITYLSNDISKIKMFERIFLKIGRELEILIFFLHFSANDISLNDLF